jgi:hypothetical protein
MNAYDVDAFYGIILPMNSGSVLAVVGNCVSVNSRSLLTGDPPSGESHGVIDVRAVLVRLARRAAPRGTRMFLHKLCLSPLLVSFLLSRLLFGEAME